MAIPVAYALSVERVPKWRDVLFFFISTKVVPIAAGIVPIYLGGSNLGLLNTCVVLVVLYLGSLTAPIRV